MSIETLRNAWLAQYAEDVLNEFFEQMEERGWSTSVRDVDAARAATLRKFEEETA